jgi:tetrahydromethanopterin S-methyltransferase subunit E
MTDDVHMTQSSFGELTQCKPQATQVVVALTSHLDYALLVASVHALLVASVHRKTYTVRPYIGRVVHPASLMWSV